jgi:GNAT superfamily N-acetyltransferase
MGPDPVEIATRVDRIRRPLLGSFAGSSVHDVPGGWLVHDRVSASEQFPSQNRNRVHWMATPVRERDVDAIVTAAADLDMRRWFLWVGPGARRDGLHGELLARGFEPWPHVEYWTLVRSSSDPGQMRPSPLTFRILREDAPETLNLARGWYGDRGVDSALSLHARGTSEFHAALDGQAPVGLAALMIDGEWSYLGFAVTAPTHRGRGGQSGLIASRLRSAAARGARWCIAETNTTVPISLGNLRRAGFQPRYQTQVYLWTPRA